MPIPSATLLPSATLIPGNPAAAAPIERDWTYNRVTTWTYTPVTGEASEETAGYALLPSATLLPSAVLIPSG